jgi:hypothetical protein
VRGESISERVEVPGVRPATFRLRWRAEDSYDLYRGSRKLGTARIEENSEWTGRFDREGKAWRATADSGEELLRLIGVFLLAQEGKDAPSAASPAVAKDVSAAERRLSAKWNRLQEERRLSRLDELIEEARTRVVAVKK